MLRFLVRLFAVVGAIACAGLAIAGVLIYGAVFGGHALPRTIVLELDLTHKLVEQVSDDPLSGALFGGDSSLRDVIDGLERARRDDRVKGVVARLGSGPGLAQAQELRAAIGRLREAGKFAIAFAETFGEFGPGNAPYYLATAFEEVWLQPVGLVGLTGISAEVPFARQALDTIGLKPELDHREEYKSAIESLTEHGFTKPHKEMMQSLIEDLTGQLVAGIATGRKLEPAAVRGLLDRGPRLAQEAVDDHLVDRLGYYDQLVDEAQARSGAESVDLQDYLSAAGSPHEAGPTIALIFAVGSIQRGEATSASLTSGATVGADDVVEAFNDAIDDDDVKAILLRVDSPGGSAIASETIRRSVLRAKAAGKPVVVSMSEAAASGGYWISMNADRIVAHPATLTGSIGVFAGKIATSAVWDRIGVAWDRVEVGSNAGIWSAVQPYSEAGRARLNAMLDDVYSNFLRNVAEGRKLTPERVKEIARGRVWTGAQALALGLVDDLGGLDLALTRAREAVGLAPDAAVTVEVFPRARSALERLADLVLDLGGAQDAAREGARIGASLQSLRPLLSRLGAMTAGPEGQVLMMPETGLIDGR